MNNRRIFINATGAVTQTVVLGATLFFLYRYLLNVLGVEKLGVWSLVLASTSVTRVANLGLTGSVVKFVAKYVARDDLIAVSKVLQTSLISIGVAMGLLLCVFYPIAPYVLELFLGPEAMVWALSILPYAFVSVWLSSLYTVYIGGLDGFQRVDQRSVLMIAGTLLHAVFAVILVTFYDLTGLAFAQVLQYIFLIIFGGIFLRRYVKIPILPYQWSSTLFREMFDYSVNFQTISIAVMLYDPVTKALLARIGGVASVGYYELASRLVVQVRGVITAANQVLVPTIAELKELDPNAITRAYDQSARVVTFLAILIFSALFVAAQPISILWIGSYELEFILTVYLLTLGWFANVLSVPVYFAYMGIGTLRWNTSEHVLKAVLNPLLGIVFGFLLGGMGVVLGWAVTLAMGSIFLLRFYHHENPEQAVIILSRPNLVLLFGAVLSAVLTIFLYNFYLWQLPGLWQLVSVAIIWSLCLVIPFWKHPIRFQFQSVAATTFSRIVT